MSSISSCLNFFDNGLPYFFRLSLPSHHSSESAIMDKVWRQAWIRYSTRWWRQFNTPLAMGDNLKLTTSEAIKWKRHYLPTQGSERDRVCRAVYAYLMAISPRLAKWKPSQCLSS